MEHEMQIYLVVFDNAAYKLSEKLFHGVASLIIPNRSQLERVGSISFSI